MNIIFVLAVTLLIDKSCSQATLSKLQDCFSHGDTLSLNCVTPDFSQTISFFLNGSPQGSCLLSVCSSGITQSGTTTVKTISPFSSSTHIGSWTCTYGGSSTSNTLLIAETPCSVTSDGSLGTGEIVGITLGCLAASAVGVFFLIVCIWMFVAGRKRHERPEDAEAIDVCCCACCWSFLVCVTCYIYDKKTRTEIDPKDIKEFIYVKKNANIEFGKPMQFATNAKWEKDGNKVKTTHRECTIFTIVNASVNNEGLYTCTLNDLKLNYYLIVVGRTETVYVKENEEVELGKTIPGIEYIPVVNWMKDKHDVLQDDLDSNKLKIMNASLHDEGTYVCTFGTKREKLTYLLIIVGTEKTINVIEGNQIEFGKEIPDSDATADAYWTKDGSIIESTSHKKTFYQIDQVDGNSKGLYVCHLGNKAELKYRLIKSA